MTQAALSPRIVDTSTTQSPLDVHTGSTSDYYDQSKTDLLDRWTPMTEWFDARAADGLDPYSKYTQSRIDTQIAGFDRAGRRFDGVNFASQDYLSLAGDGRVVAAQKAAAETYGVHSAGSAALMGLTARTLDLERRIAQFLNTADATVFPTGWGAGYGAIRTLVGPSDHVVIDVLAHACLQEAATVSTGNVHRFPHLSNAGVRRRLSRVRNAEPDAGILVVTETVFSMDSDVPDIVELQDICHEFNATLMVDAAHDLGALGKTGRGCLEMQNMLGKVDLVMGSFSKTFASNGGFVATDHPGAKLALRYGCGPLTFSNALSPVQCAVILRCFDIVESRDGEKRRLRMMANAINMRTSLKEEGFKVLGAPSAIVPVVLGPSPISREMTSYVIDNGGIVNLVEYPAVARNGCRWRLQVMADHRDAQIDQFVQLAVEAREWAKNRGFT